MIWVLGVLAFYVLVFAGILALRRLARADVDEWGGAAGRGGARTAPPPSASC